LIYLAYATKWLGLDCEIECHVMSLKHILSNRQPGAGVLKTIQIVRRVVIFGSVIAAFGCLTYQGSMEREFLIGRRTPAPALGRTVPLSLKSTTVYVTASENTLYLRLVWGTYIACFVGAISAMSHKKWPMR
jgi:hypothetical protein